MTAAARILVGDVRTVLPTLPAESVRCCVTSPPYFGLRDYGMPAQMGLEATPAAFVEALVDVFREVRRVLTDDGTLWLNLGDSYATDGPRSGNSDGYVRGSAGSVVGYRKRVDDAKPKDLLMMPARVALALQADGWYLRSDIVWSKPNPMPESVTDRPTKSHEYVFLLSKSPRYYYDAASIAEPVTLTTVERMSQPNLEHQAGSDRVPGKTNGPMKAVLKRSGNKARVLGTNAAHPHRGTGIPWEGSTRNARTVWTIATRPYSGAHFATMPPELAERCIKAGSAPGDTVLDPFAGSGTTLAAAVGNGRRGLGIELNPEYAALAAQRIGPLLTEVA